MQFSPGSFGIEVKNNVLYDVAGINVYVMGMFTSIELMGNVIVNPKNSYKMYRIDFVPSNIKIDGPMNIIVNNRIGGGNHNAIWGELTRRSYAETECASGLPFGSFSGNTIHSMKNAIYLPQVSSRSSSCSSNYNSI